MLESKNRTGRDVLPGPGHGKLSGCPLQGIAAKIKGEAQRVEKRKKKKESLIKAVTSGMKLPPPELYMGASLHISSMGAVQVEGCKGVSLYNENFVEVDLGKCRARISGDELVLVALSKHPISVEGKLFSIEFSY